MREDLQATNESKDTGDETLNGGEDSVEERVEGGEELRCHGELLDLSEDGVEGISNVL